MGVTMLMLMLMLVAVTMAMAIAVIVTVLYKTVSLNPESVGLERRRIFHTMQEEYANQIQTEADTSHNQDKLRLFNLW